MYGLKSLLALFYIYILMRIRKKNMNYVHAKSGTYLHTQYLIGTCRLIGNAQLKLTV